jgi:hypothetical protein
METSVPHFEIDPVLSAHMVHVLSKRHQHEAHDGYKSKKVGGLRLYPKSFNYSTSQIWVT